ncbi:hypothetical protein SAY86_015871 [Trapa natans]|uniref:Uncharacterized protein n=1 Tax=Trapa natans TaxID=22666 RepID=A0AAN7LCR3_TRANT|nr:hypothetical protein SAY86_015871 [Trapa natans]
MLIVMWTAQGMLIIWLLKFCLLTLEAMMANSNIKHRESQWVDKIYDLMNTVVTFLSLKDELNLLSYLQLKMFSIIGHVVCLEEGRVREAFSIHCWISSPGLHENYW